MTVAYVLSDSTLIVGGLLETFLETVDTKETLTDERQVLEIGEGFVVVQGSNESRRYKLECVKNNCGYYSLDN